MKCALADTCDLDEFLAGLADERTVFALEEGEDRRLHLVETPAWSAQQHTLGAYRPTEPLKSLFFPAREFLGTWHGDAASPGLPERIVFGVKNCDLSALSVFDQVFLEGDCQDPYYAEARRQTILVSSDCSGFLDVCFCPAVGEQPFALAGFDINISATPAGYLVESGSERGERLLQTVDRHLVPAAADLLAAVETERQTRYGDLVAHARRHGLSPGVDLRGAVDGAFESGMWGRFAAECVECCTCHCFLLADGFDAAGKPARSKQWDACLFTNFAATAGGHNPRPLRAERLRNRFDKKFRYFPEVMGRYACDGCGRCTEACIAKIDIREVLRTAVDECDAISAHAGND